MKLLCKPSTTFESAAYIHWLSSHQAPGKSSHDGVVDRRGLQLQEKDCPGKYMKDCSSESLVYVQDLRATSSPIYSATNVALRCPDEDVQ